MTLHPDNAAILQSRAKVVEARKPSKGSLVLQSLIAADCELRRSAGAALITINTVLRTAGLFDWSSSNARHSDPTCATRLHQRYRGRPSKIVQLHQPKAALIAHAANKLPCRCRDSGGEILVALFALTMEVPDWRRFVVRDA